MTTPARTTWLVTGVAVVGLALIAALFLVPKLVVSGEEDGETISHRLRSQHNEGHDTRPRSTDEYWTEKRIREAEPAGPVAVSPVPYRELAAGAGILIVVGTTIVWLLRRQRRG
ncbi:hypothetical protein SAMN04487820_103367 [Actinopolyspora mzabensis]|uniref:Uncharacterized protein n=1 Tax=Actinopolyspora mzabensis TaxID=995066 RepID=A0A1G8YBM6_ACTMZ|nr:hypothetical protein [Actinopolyspora mzabensis]SDK00262.1 hypothetical protein SAMN04487820_103367 [Actinopolyspora mzabensis]